MLEWRESARYCLETSTEIEKGRSRFTAIDDLIGSLQALIEKGGRISVDSVAEWERNTQNSTQNVEEP